MSDTINNTTRASREQLLAFRDEIDEVRGRDGWPAAFEATRAAAARHGLKDLREIAVVVYSIAKPRGDYNEAAGAIASLAAKLLPDFRQPDIEDPQRAAFISAKIVIDIEDSYRRISPSLDVFDEWELSWLGRVFVKPSAEEDQLDERKGSLLYDFELGEGGEPQ